MRAKVSPLSAGPVSHMTHGICITLLGRRWRREGATAHGQDGGRGMEESGSALWTNLELQSSERKKARVRFSFDMHLQPVIGGSVFERFSSKSPWSSLLKRVEGTDGQSSESLVWLNPRRHPVFSLIPKEKVEFNPSGTGLSLSVVK